MEEISWDNQSIAKHVTVIGGGAAGFFAAINTAIKHPDYRISILEKTGKLLSKVKVSGGGRCNVTHHCFDNSELVRNYPRGQKELYQAFSRFSVKDTIAWFESNGVKLKTEEDGRMFPITDSSQSIIDCFLKLCERHKINIQTHTEVFAIKKTGQSFLLKTNNGEIKADAVICSIGGHNKTESYFLIKNLGHKIIDPIPSLFTINLPEEPIKKELQGVAIKQAEVKIEGTKLHYNGPVLITHWGLSGPAVLKLSAFAAKEFYNKGYDAMIIVNWLYPLDREDTEQELKKFQKGKPRALPLSHPLGNLPKRLWEFLCRQAEIDNTKSWAEVSNKQLHKLADSLHSSKYHMHGKTTFKEEFVSCGGIDLKEIDFKTMQSRLVPGLYFCGEVLNIDGITGGFNFQAAWTTAWICSNLV